MASKDNIDPQVRGFYFSQSGDTEFDGTSYELPKATMQEAIDEANALVPPPSGAALAVVSSAQGGSFTSGFTLFDFIQFNGTNVSITENTAIAIELASFLRCNITSLSNAMAASTCFNIDGQSFLAVECDLINVFGTGGAKALKVTGACDNLFLGMKQITLIGDGSIGIDITSSSPTPIDIEVDTVSLDGDNTICMNYDPVNSTDTCIIDVGSISDGGSNTTGFIVENGRLLVLCGLLDATTAIHLKAGSEYTTLTGEIIGDIIVDSGARLDAVIIRHTGTLTNNGTINGIINGEYFGTWRQKAEDQLVLRARSFSTQAPVGLDILTQVEFGAAQFGPTDPVEIDVLGNVTINQSDQYQLSVRMHYGRSGAGSFAVMFTRLLVDGVQLGGSQATRLDNANTHISIDHFTPIDLLVGQVLTVEIWRDSSGFDAGELLPEVPALVGPNPQPSASIVLTRSRLVQPVD